MKFYFRRCLWSHLMPASAADQLFPNLKSSAAAPLCGRHVAAASPRHEPVQRCLATFHSFRAHERGCPCRSESLMGWVDSFHSACRARPYSRVDVWRLDDAPTIVQMTTPWLSNRSCKVESSTNYRTRLFQPHFSSSGLLSWISNVSHWSV